MEKGLAARPAATGRAGENPLAAALRSPGWALGVGVQLANARWSLRHRSVGRHVRVKGRLRVEGGGEIRVGDWVQIHSHHATTVLAAFSGGRIEIGDRTFINYGCDIAATELVWIGPDCLLGTHVAVLDNAFHDLHNRARRPAPKPVVIQAKVWIANHAMILPGVTIGAGAVVAAGAVVTTDVPAMAVVAGNPARVIKLLDHRSTAD